MRLVKTDLISVLSVLVLLGCQNPAGNLIPSSIVFADGATVTRQLGSGSYTNPVSGAGSGEIAYQSEYPSIAAVDAATGAVTLVSAGSTRITAVKASTATHGTATASYTLNVTGLSPSTIVFADGLTVSRQLDSGAYTNPVSGVGDGEISYSSSNITVAAVDDRTGELSLCAVGSTVISATRSSSGTYESASASYTLTVTAIPSAIVFADGQAVSRMLGSGPYTNAVSGAGDGELSYTSSNPDAATVDQRTGQVRITLHYPAVGLGSTVITATKAATPTHSAASGAYTLTVTEPQLLDGTKIGEPYQGGILALILRYGDPGYSAEVEHGLVVSLEALGLARWADSATPWSGASDWGIGAGQTNSSAIVARFGAGTGYAAGLCDAYSNVDTGTGVFSDWYLPSYEELEILLGNKADLGMTASVYWSSTNHQYSSCAAYSIDATGAGWSSQPSAWRENLLTVRAVRSF